MKQALKISGSILAVLAAILVAVIFLQRSDKDQDRYFSYSMPLPLVQVDCNDDDPSIYPSANEIPNDGKDQDCKDGDLLIPVENLDQDGDGYSPNNGDCNDSEKSIYPNAIETDDDQKDSNCDGKDNNESGREIILMENMVTPLPPFSPPARAIVKYLGGKILLLPSELASAHLQISVGVKEGVQKPDLIGVGLYIETDVQHENKDFWEYNAHIGEGYVMQNGECTNQLLKNSVYVLPPKTQQTLEFPLLDMKGLPLVLDRDQKGATTCGRVEDVNLINLLNAAAREGKSVKIALYTTSPLKGQIIQAKLFYEGKEITVVEP